MMFRLDPNVETQANGETLLCSERAVLEAVVAMSPATFLVQGHTLCSWMAEWCDGRNLPCETVVSPRAIWRILHPTWTDAEITVLQNQAGLMICPPTAEDALEALFPHFPFPDQPCADHAAQWLLWLDDTHIADTNPARPLLRFVGETWRTVCDEGNLLEQSAYRVNTTDNAQAMLHDWLLKGRFAVTFPRSVPQKWQVVAHNLWKYEIIAQGAKPFWQSIVDGTFSSDLCRVAALLSGEYLTHHPEQITPDLVTSLRKHLPVSLWQELQKTCPPPMPETVSPDSLPAAVLAWFKNKYLPFRQWQVLFGSKEQADHVRQVAQSFAEWLLLFYPKAVAGGSGYDVLAIAESARLQRTKGVTLWIILDGMPVPDGEFLLGLLRKESRFTVAADRLCFSTLPTITCFCKPALMNGRPSEGLALNKTPSPDFPSAVLLKDKTMHNQAAAAQNGQVLVWSHKNPDGIYHRNQSRETTTAEVHGQLELFAARIREIAFAVPSERSLSLVVSTDHGRLLSSGVARSHSVSSGLTPEGRTAWGTPTAPPPLGVVVLDTEPFRLPAGVTAWVAQDENAFVQANGSGGMVAFPHGGLWPEEVITPWFSLVRDVRVPALRIAVEGNGRNGGMGRCTITIDNADSSVFTILSLRLTNAVATWVWKTEESVTVSAQEREVHEQEINPYPGADELEGTFTGEATVLLPSGVTLPVATTVDMKTDTLYQRGLSAQDLLEF